MELHSMFVWERFATAIKIDRIPLFDVRRSLVFSFINQAVVLAGGPPEAEHLKPLLF